MRDYTMYEKTPVMFSGAERKFEINCVSIVSKVFAHGFIQFRFWIGKDQALTTLHRLEDQISGYGSGFACARRATYGEVGIEACVFGECEDLTIR